MQAPVPIDRLELRRFLSWLLLGALTGAIVAIALTFVWTPRWEASVQIRPGQVASSAGGQPPMPVEPPARITERINSRAFADTLRDRLGLAQASNDSRSKLLRDSLRATLLERASLVQVRIEGYYPEEAQAWLEAATALVAEAHAPMFQPTVERLTAQLAEIAADIERIGLERERLIEASAEIRKGRLASEQFSQSVLVGNLLNIRDAELRSLRDRAATISEMLSPERTFQTGPIGRVTVTDRPSFPRRPVHAVAGAILGAILGGAFGLFVRRRR